MKEPVKKPGFFIVGNSKSGTTALYKFLDEHPDVCMCEPKEPNVFAHDFLHDVDTGAFRRKSIDEYLRYFDDPSQKMLWGEASGCYLYSNVAAREIAAFNPEAKIIIMLREPVDFLHSYHLQMLKNPRTEGETVKNFREALALEERRKKGELLPRGCLIPALLFYSERIRYRDQIERFLDHFDCSQIKIIIYEEFKADNGAIFTDVLEFLNIDPNFKPTFDEFNKGVKLKSKMVQNGAYRLSRGDGIFRGLHRAIKALLPAHVRRFVLRQVYRNVVFGRKPEIDPDLRSTLVNEFRGEVRKLSDLLGRDLLSQWGYGELDGGRRGATEADRRSKTMEPL